MANQDVNNTILTEHRRIVGSRYFLALINFLAILLGTGVTLFFVIKRGSPPIMQVYLYILLGINLAQIGLCLADYLLKTRCGVYRKELSIISYAVAGLWLVLLIAELITGTLEYQVLRVDLLLLTIIQLAVALVAYLVWPHMDRRAIDAMIQSKVKANPAKRNSISKRFVAIYVLLSLFVVMAQAGSLLVYKVSPRLYDLFAESRAVKYELTEEGDGYVVAYVYTGTSPYVNIPATYNNKPVVGLKKGALKDDALLEKNKITKITFGTPSTNEAGQEIVVNNLKFIESGAISNNNIETLIIPETVQSIGAGAIVSTSLKKIEYAARADFNAQSIAGCTALENIVMSGTNVGSIVSLEGLNSKTTIEVDKEIYNTYRQNNFNYVSSFSPILDEGEFCVDFYTGIDYYINSIICKSGESISLSYKDLKNDKSDAVSLVADTLAYIRDNREVGTDGAKEASAFRGWYEDAAFTQEVPFTEDGEVSITKSKALYAKWVTEYTGTLNWGTFKPEGAEEEVHWTAEDVVATFPVITDRSGYAGGVEWRISDTQEQVFTSENRLSDITLDATWILDKPVVDIVSKLNTEILPETSGKDIVSYTYDEAKTLWLEAEYTHALTNITHEGEATDYEFYWTKVDSNRTSETNSIDLNQVADSGTYQLQVTVYSPYGESASANTNIQVTINKKDIQMGTATLADGSKEYNGAAQKVAYDGDLESKNVKVAYTYYDKNGAVLNTNDGVKDAGEYKVIAIFEKNNQAEAANYLTKELQATFIIEPQKLTYGGWEGNGMGWDGNTVVYNGETKQYKMKIGGILPNDEVELEYEENSHTGLNAGEYISVVTGITNPNYTWSDEMREHSQASWEILPKQVTVKAWEVDGSGWTDKTIVYDGKQHSVYAVLEGMVNDEDVDFVYSGVPDFSNKAINAGEYRAKINGVDNANYYFDVSEDNPLATCDWTILRRELKVEFNNPALTYNGTKQGVTATISNFVSTEFYLFGENMFATEAFENIKYEKFDASNTIQFSYTALDAKDYTATMNGLKTSENPALLNNYDLVETSKDFTIAQRKLTIQKENKSYTYNGEEQTFKVNVSNILPQDLEGVNGFNLSQFVTGATQGAIEAVSGTVSGANYQLGFKGKNAGEYTLSIDAFNGNTNYMLEAYTTNFEIAKKDLVISKWQLTNKTNDAVQEYGLAQTVTPFYNHFGYIVTPIYSGVIDGETVDLTLENSEQTQAGVYTTKASLDQMSYPNYTMETKTKSWEIKRLEIEITWTIDDTTEHEFVYDGHEWTVEPQYTLLEDDTLTLTYENAANLARTNKGIYPVKITGIGNNNYTVKNPECKWTINAKALTLTWKPQNSYTYTGAYQGPAFTLDGVQEADVGTMTLGAKTWYDDTVTGTQSVEITSLEATQEYKFAVDTNSGFALDAGKHKIEELKIYKDGVIDTNYSINATYSYTIVPKTFTLTWKPLISYTYTGTYQGPTFMLNGVDATDLGGNLYVSANTWYNNAHAGKQNVKITSSEATQIYMFEVNAASNFALDAGDHKIDSLTICKYENGEIVSDSNYQITTQNPTDLEHTYTIAKKTITLTGVWNYTNIASNGEYNNLTAESIIYNKSNYTLETAIATGSIVDRLNDGSMDAVTLVYSNNKKLNAGTYTAKVASLDGAGASNYQLPTQNLECNWTIAPKVIALSWENINKVYSGFEQTQNATITNGYSGDAIVLTYAQNHKATNAGTYTVNVTAIDNPNYTITGATDLSSNWTIQRKSIALTWNTSTFTYNGTVQHPTASYYDASTNETISVSEYANSNGVAVTANFNAGTYILEAKTLDNPNYVIDQTGDKHLKEYTIKPFELTLTWYADGSTNLDLTYTRQERLITVTANTFGADVVNLTYENNAFTNAGTYTVTVGTNLGNDNYVLVNNTKSITVAPKKVTFAWTWDGLTEQNGEVPTFTYDTTETRELVATADGVIAGDTVNVYYLEATNSFANVGTHTVTVKQIDNDNYTFDVEAKTLTIAPQQVVVTWTGETNLTYDSEEHTLEASVKGVDGKTLEFSYGANGNKFENAGTHTVTITLTDSNYTLVDAEGGASKDLVIAQRIVALSWSGLTNTYYKNQTYTATATVDNIYGGDTVTVNSYSAVKESEYGQITNNSNKTQYAGEYTITAVGLSNANYTLVGATDTEATLSVEKQKVTIVWNSNDDLAYNGNTRSLTAVIKGENDGNGVLANYEVTKDGFEAICKTVGTYTFKIASLQNDNYTLDGASIENLSNTLTIIPRVVTLSWANKTATYNGSEHTLSATASNKVSGDTLEFTYSAEKTSTYGDIDANVNATKYAGVYTITVTGVSNENYTLVGTTSVISHTLTVKPQKVTIAWGASEFEYDRTLKYLSATVKGATDGVEVAFTLDNNGGYVNVGSYPVAVVLEDTNYTLEGVNSTSKNLIINRQKVSIVWGENEFEYDGDLKQLTATVKGATDGEDVAFTLNNNGKTNADSYVVTVSLNNDNYTLDGVSNTSEDLIIKAQKVSIVWGENEFEYDGTMKQLTATVKGATDGASVNFTLNKNGKISVGSYVVTVSLNNDNYTLDGVSNTSEDLIIKAQKVTIAWGTNEFTYDGTEKQLTATVKGATDGEDVAFNLVNNGQVNVGSYEVKVVLNTANYTLDGVSNTINNLIIKAQKVTITWGTTKTFTYDGTEKFLTAEVKGESDGTNVAFGLANNGAVSADSYVVRVVLSNNNYTLDGVTNATETLTINKAVATIVWSNTECEYDGNVHLPTVTVTGVNGVALTYELSATGFTAVGTYTVEVDSLDNENYTLVGANSSTTFTIKAPVTPPVQA